MTFIPVNQPLLDGNEKKYLLECLETGWISSEGPFVKRFEDEFAKKVGRNYGVAVSNGSVALDAAIVALGIGPGDEVIMPTFTIISCAGAIVRAGAIPVVVDCDAITWNMITDKLEEKITAKTKAILVVHIFGLPVDMGPVMALSQKYGLKLIEDAAEAHGQTYNMKPCGSFGDISCFSFYPNKHITTGEGGMLLTDDAALAERCRSLRNLCFKPEQRFIHDELGWNLRMTNMQAALGVAQLEQLGRFIDRKKRMGAFYHSLLSGLDTIQLPLTATQYAENHYWVFGIVLQDDFPFEAKEVMNRLNKMGVGTRPFFWPMHEQPVLKKMGFFKNERYPNAERLARRGFYIPSGLALNDKQMEKVALTVRAVLQ